MLESLQEKPGKRKICYVTTISMTIRAFFIPQLKYLAEHGFDITVVCSPDSTLQEELGNQIHYYPVKIPRGISVVGSFGAIRQLTHLFKQEKYDMIQYSTPNAALYAAISSAFANTAIRNYHLMGFRFLGATGVARTALKALEKLTCGLSSSIECVSNSNLELGFKEKLFSPEKATVVWNGSSGGVDLSRFDYSMRNLWRKQIREALGYQESDFVFGFVGRITRDKGINEILEAFFGISYPSKLLFVGDMEGIDTINPELLEKSRTNPDIQFHESVADIERYYAAFDVLLLPSYREGFGNVIIEAAAMGTPSVISDIPGPIDAVEIGRTAYVVSPHNASELKETMGSLAKGVLSLDSECCMKFAKEKFDSLTLCEKVYERKQKLLGD